MVLRKQHYLQACAQGSVLLYWGWYWPPVYAFAPFILAQLFFAYAFDMLLGWSRRDTYALGFGSVSGNFQHQSVPVVQAGLVLFAVPDGGGGLAAKEFIRWNRDGRRVHIFNPSSFPLAVFSLALLATGMSGITWGANIASTQFYPPQMYLFLFLIGLPGQFFFGVTSMTMSAVVAAYAFGRIYFAATGIYFFYDSYIPIAVFLGMHLLFNDPSTSPRTELGRIVYGALYGLSTLRAVPTAGRRGNADLLRQAAPGAAAELSVKGIDRRWRDRSFCAARSRSAGPRHCSPRQRNLAYMSIWAIVFVAISAVQGVGDNHPGQWLPFWQARLRGWTPLRLPLPCRLGGELLRSGLGLGVQRSGLDGYRPIAVGRGSSQARSRWSSGTARARVRTWLCSGLPESEDADKRHWFVRRSAAGARRPSHHLERQQRRDPRARTVGVVRASLQGGLDGQVRDDALTLSARAESLRAANTRALPRW